MTQERTDDIRRLLSGARTDSLALAGLEADGVAAGLLDHGAVAIEHADAVMIAAGRDLLETIGRLEDVVARGNPRIVLIDDVGDRAAAYAAVWATRHEGWLALEAPPDGLVVLAPSATIADSPDLPGAWRRPEQAPRTALALAPQDDHAALASQRLEVDRLRAALAEQREWVAGEAERARASLSWRLGHRLVRIGRLLTFRRGRGTDALGRLAERMRAPLEL